MRYVERNQGGEITATYARPQQGKNLERLPDDHPDIAAFRDRTPAEQRLTAEDIWSVLEAKGVVSEQDRPK